MGTYTDLLKLNKKPTPLPTQPESSGAVTTAQTFTPTPAPPLSQGMVWQSEAAAERADRPIAETPSGEIAEKPDNRPAKSPDRRASKRRAVRHGIDMYRDQLVALNKIQFALWRRDDKKPTLRELILTALDNYIEKMKTELGEK